MPTKLAGTGEPGKRVFAVVCTKTFQAPIGYQHYGTVVEADKIAIGLVAMLSMDEGVLGASSSVYDEPQLKLKGMPTVIEGQESALGGISN